MGIWHVASLSALGAIVILVVLWTTPISIAQVVCAPGEEDAFCVGEGAILSRSYGMPLPFRTVSQSGIGSQESRVQFSALIIDAVIFFTVPFLLGMMEVFAPPIGKRDKPTRKVLERFALRRERLA